MASVSTSVSEKTNGKVDKPASKGAETLKPVAEPDVAGVEEADEDEFERAGAEGEDEDEEDEDEDFEVDDEEERRIVGDEEEEEEEEEDQEEAGEESGGQTQPQSLTHYLIPETEGQENGEEEFDDEDVYIPPAPEPISRKRSHQEVEDVEEPDSKKSKA